MSETDEVLKLYSEHTELCSCIRVFNEIVNPYYIFDKYNSEFNEIVRMYNTYPGIYNVIRVVIGESYNYEKIECLLDMFENSEHLNEDNTIQLLNELINWLFNKKD